MIDRYYNANWTFLSQPSLFEGYHCCSNMMIKLLLCQTKTSLVPKRKIIVGRGKKFFN